MKEFPIITENEAGQRFDKYLAKLLRNAPKSFFYKMLRKKNIITQRQKSNWKRKAQHRRCRSDCFLSDETFSEIQPTGTCLLVP